MNSISVLVIDDDILHLRLMKDRLEDIGGINVQLANSYQEGVDALDNAHPDLIIIDYYLDSDKTSVDFVKENLVYRDIPIIAISSFYNNKIFTDVLQFVPMDFLSKSCSDFELEKAVRLALAKKQDIENIKLKDHLFVKVGNVIRKIYLNNLEMIEVDGRFLKLYTEGKSYLIRSSLNDFVKKLPTNFIKVHQSYVINSDFIEFINI